LAAVAFAGLTLAPAGSADEPTSLQTAVAMEEAMSAAIGRAERSVVAIARVRRHDNEPLDLNPNFFGQPQVLERASPGTAEFIPNEYATGVVVGADGLILTAAHVLRENCDYWITTAEGKIHKVKRVKGADPRSDLAVLEIEASGLVPIKFGDASKLKKGKWVIALGNPYAIARDGQVSASLGIVANLSRKDGPLPEPGPQNGKRSLHQYGTLIHTDARLNLGTSGGALINLDGEMVGLTVSLAAAAGYEQSAGFAIPVDETFLRAVNTLKQGSEVEYGLLGVELRPLSPDEQRKGERVRITGIREGMPAQRFGLVANDAITHVNGQEIRQRDDVFLAIGKLPPEASAVLNIEREGTARVIVVEELMKYNVPGDKVVTNPPPAWRGLRVDYVTVARDFDRWAGEGVLDLQGSIWISEVAEGSPAWAEGLRADMLISHVAGNRVTTPKQFFEQVAGKSGPVKLRINPRTSAHVDRVIPPEAG
jgi:S1-C subfamily serine protease